MVLNIRRDVIERGGTRDRGIRKKGKVQTLEVIIRQLNEERLRLNRRQLSRSTVWWAV